MPTLHVQEKANKSVCKPKADSEVRAIPPNGFGARDPKIIYPPALSGISLFKGGKRLLCPVGHLLYERRQFRKASSFRGGGTQCGRSQKSPGRTMFAPTVCLSSRYKCNHTNKKSGQFCAVRFLFKKSLDFRFRLFRCIRRHNVPDFEPEGRAFAQLAVYAVVVVVHLQNLFDDGQPQSRSHHFTLVVL